MRNQTSKRDISRLENIQTLVDAKQFNRELVFEQLLKINIKFLSPYRQVHYYYVSARFHFNCYKEDNAIEHLELASDLLDAMDELASEQRVRFDRNGYDFTRAYIKFVLANSYWDEYSSPYYLAKASRITDRALTIDPKSQSFKWLKKQLSA